MQPRCGLKAAQVGHVPVSTESAKMVDFADGLKGSPERAASSSRDPDPGLDPDCPIRGRISYGVMPGLRDRYNRSTEPNAYISE
ncbi:hypothetical protein HYQ44_016040 [Verticillium longisporum]|nr:hypothetical protein HYQ44_016040 [Verticillium longisporum]